MPDPRRSGASPENAWWSVKVEKQKSNYAYNHLRRESVRDYKRAVEKEVLLVVLPNYFSIVKREDKAKVCVHWMVHGANQSRTSATLSGLALILRLKGWVAQIRHNRSVSVASKFSSLAKVTGDWCRSQRT